MSRVSTEIQGSRHLQFAHYVDTSSQNGEQIARPVSLPERLLSLVAIRPIPVLTAPSQEGSCTSLAIARVSLPDGLDVWWG